MRHFKRAMQWFGGLFLVTWPAAEMAKHGVQPSLAAALLSGAVAGIIWLISIGENWD